MVYYVKIQKYVIWRNHMILACQNISKAFGTTEIIKNASFHIELSLIHISEPTRP